MVLQTDLETETTKHKLYKRRWIMMVIFMMFTFNVAVQWGQYAVITNLVTKYYDVSATQVEWTATIFTLSYILFVFPALFVLDKFGVRNSLVLGCLGIFIGTWLKAFSTSEDGFATLFIGQCCTALSYMFTYGLTGRFTALWFGADEISTAGVLPLLGDQLGVAFAFYMPTVVVKQGTKETIGDGLRMMNYMVAIYSSIIFALVLFFFKEKPELPPCMAQVKQRQLEKETIPAALRSMFSKKSFVYVMFSYGLNIGPYIAVVTLLNGLMSDNFPGEEEHAGKIGSLMMLVGILSSFISGRILDKTRRFKESAAVLTAGSAIFFVLFTWALKSESLMFVYISAILYGYFAMGYYTTGFQIGIEITYPVSESSSTSVAFFFTSFFGFVFTVIYGYTIKSYGDLASNIGFIIIYVITVAITLLMPVDLKRQEAENTKNETEGMKDLI